jgi:acyl-CoA thioesterase FadM
MAAKCERATELMRVSDGAVVAKARTIWGYIDQASGRPTRIHEVVRAAFANAVTPLASHRPWPGA